MTIKLKGILDSELEVIGLKPGMIIDEYPDKNSTSGVVHFETIHGGRTYNCSVWPENYDRRKYRVCGCIDDDCHQCIEKTGQPCYWIEWDLCSACAPAIQEDENKRNGMSIMAKLLEKD